MEFSRSKFKSAFFDPPLAHRALHDAARGILENSEEAINAAIVAGYGIEIDLQATKDARAVVFHDETLDRLTNRSGRVRNLTLNEMEATPLKGGGHIISFASCLALLNGLVPLLVEVKDQSGELGPNLGNFMPDIIEQARAYEGPLAFMSFSPYIIAHLRAALPHAALGLVTDRFKLLDWPRVPRKRAENLRDMAEIPNLDIDFISHYWRDLERVKDIDLPKLCWTIRSPDAEVFARQYAQNITFENYRPTIK